MAYNIHYASGANAEDTGLPPQLMAGDTPAVVTQDFAITVSSAPIKQFTPLKIDGGNYVPWTSGSEVAAIAPFDLPVGSYRKALYTAGMFNIDALNWPAGTTEAQADAAQTGMVRYRKLLHSDKRTGNESENVGPGNEAGQVVFDFTPSSGALSGTTEGANYSQSVSATGGVGDKTYAVTDGALPAGVTIDPDTGALSGTVGATAEGNYTFEITATDEAGNTGSAVYTLTVADGN